MRVLSMIMMVGILASTTAPMAAHAATSKKEATKKTSKQASKRSSKSSKSLDSAPAAVSTKREVSRDIRFNGSTVDGKYLSAGETIAEVEGEKRMGTLIGIRKNFRDKLAAENARLASGKGQ